MLKVGSPQPQFDTQMPPMNPTDMEQMPPEDGQFGNSAGMDGGSEFDTNFDAGVDADEDSDPKKYIQQLTGKLSQSLRKYNESLPNPEPDLCKYVAGMIVTQAVNGLTDKDKKEIIDKVKGGVSDESQPQPEDFGNETGPDFGNGQPMNEHISHRKMVNEIFQDLLRKKDKPDEPAQYGSVNNIGFKKKPFTAPKMK